MSNLELQSVIYREDKHYVAQCLNIDVSSFGDSEANALANLQEALELSVNLPRGRQDPYLESCRRAARARMDRHKQVTDSLEVSGGQWGSHSGSRGRAPGRCRSLPVVRRYLRS